MSDTQISLPYIYHQSPVYTLPCLSRPGGPHRRAEPQYKFVEEIITETTREIEMSEFEETGSEETEVEKDEQGCTKRDRGSSEEESDNKDGGEGEGEQESDGEQDQVVNGGDDGPESEAGENIEDKNTQSEVLLSESLDGEDEQHQKVAENTKEEKEAAATVSSKPHDLKPEVPKEDSLLKTSKPHDLTPEVPKEDNLLKKSGDAKKEDAEKDGFISAQAKEPVDETSAQEDKTQELSSVQVQDETPTSETAEKTADFTEETKSTLSVKTEELSEKAQVSSSTTPKREEKENSHTQPKEISKSEVAKDEDKVAQGSSNKGQDKESSLKPDVKSLPEVKDQKPNNGDETQTVQAELLRDKTTGIKEQRQGAPEGSQVQKSKPSEVPEKIKEPEGKAEKVESSKK